MHYRTVVQLPVAVNPDPVSAKFVRCVCDCKDGVRPGSESGVVCRKTKELRLLLEACWT